MPDIVKIFEEHPPEAVTFKSGNKTYTVSRDEFVFLRDSAKKKRQYSPDFFSQYKESTADSQLRRAGLPTLSSWNDLTEWAASGDISSNYGNLADKEWNKLNELWKQEWQYSLTDEDFRRQQAGLPPVEYDAKYENTLLDDELKSRGLPPSKLLNGNLGEKYTKFVTDSETYESVMNDIAVDYYANKNAGMSENDAMVSAIEKYATSGENAGFFLDHYEVLKDIPVLEQDKYRIVDEEAKALGISDPYLRDETTGEYVYDREKWLTDYVSALKSNASKEGDEFAFTYDGLLSTANTSTAFSEATELMDALTSGDNITADDINQVFYGVPEAETDAYMKATQEVAKKYADAPATAETVSNFMHDLSLVPQMVEEQEFEVFYDAYLQGEKQKYNPTNESEWEKSARANEEKRRDAKVNYYITRYGLNTEQAKKCASGQVTVNQALTQQTASDKGRSDYAVISAVVGSGIGEIIPELNEYNIAQTLAQIGADGIFQLIENSKVDLENEQKDVTNRWAQANARLQNERSAEAMEAFSSVDEESKNVANALRDLDATLSVFDAYKTSWDVASAEYAANTYAGEAVTDEDIANGLEAAKSDYNAYKNLLDENMTDEQRYVVGYLYKTAGQEAVGEYLTNIAKAFDNLKLAERQEKFAEWGKEHPFWAILGSAALIAPTEAAYNLIIATLDTDRKLFKGKDPIKTRYATYSSFMSGGAAESANTEAGKFLIQAAPSLIQNAGWAVADVFSHGATAIPHAIAMSAQAFSDSYTTAIYDDASIGQAWGVGLASGVSEFVFEKVSIDRFLKGSNILSDIIGNQASYATRKAFTKDLGFAMARAIVEQTATEASEEALTEVANIFSNGLIRGIDSDFNKLTNEYLLQNPEMSTEEAAIKAIGDLMKRVGSSALQGAMSGLLLSGGRSAVGGVQSLTSIYSKVSNTSSVTVERGVEIALKNGARLDSPMTAQTAERVFSKLYAMGADQATIISVARQITGSTTSSEVQEIASKYGELANRRTFNQVSKAYMKRAKKAGMAEADVTNEINDFLRRQNEIATAEQSATVQEALQSFRSAEGYKLQSALSGLSEETITGAEQLADYCASENLEADTALADSLYVRFLDWGMSEQEAKSSSVTASWLMSAVESQNNVGAVFGTQESADNAKANLLTFLRTKGNTREQIDLIGIVLQAADASPTLSTTNTSAFTNGKKNFAIIATALHKASEMPQSSASFALYSDMLANGYSDSKMDMLLNLLVYEGMNEQEKQVAHNSAKVLSSYELSSATAKIEKSADLILAKEKSFNETMNRLETEVENSKSTVRRYIVEMSHIPKNKPKKLASAASNLNNAKRALVALEKRNAQIEAKAKEEYERSFATEMEKIRTTLGDIQANSAAFVIQFKSEIDAIAESDNGAMSRNDEAVERKLNETRAGQGNESLAEKKALNDKASKAKNVSGRFGGKVVIAPFSDELNNQLGITGTNRITANDKSVMVNGTLYINESLINADDDLDMTVLYAEIVKLMNNQSENAKQVLRSSVESVVGNMDESVRNVKEKAAESGKSLSDEEAVQEVLRVAVRASLKNPDILSVLVKANPALFSEIKAKVEVASESSESSEVASANARLTNEGIIATKPKETAERGVLFPTETTYEELIERHGAFTDSTGTVPARPVPTRNAGDKPITQAASTLMNSPLTTEQQAQKIRDMIVDGKLMKRTKSNEQTINEAREFIERNGVESTLREIQRMADSGATNPETLAKAIVLYESVQAQTQGFDREVTQTDLDKLSVDMNEMFIENMAQFSSSAGRTLNFWKTVKTMTPDGRIYAIEKVGKNLSEKYEKKQTEKKPSFTLTDEERQAYKSAQTVAELDAVDAAVTARWGQETEPTFADMVRSWRYLAMLSNPKTHMRNVLGNLLKSAEMRVTDVVQAGLEKVANIPQEYRMSAAVAAKMTDKQREVFNSMLDEIVQNVTRNPKYLTSAKSARTLEQSVIANRKSFTDKTFVGKGLNKAANLVFGALEKEDIYAVGNRARAKFAQLVKARDIDVENMSAEQRQDIIQLLAQDAAEATFREYSALSDALTKLEDTNKATRFIVGALFPFKTTVINVAKSGVRLTPYSLVKGAANLRKATAEYNKQKDKNPEAYENYVRSKVDALHSLSQGVTGTAAIGIGAILARLGVLSITRREDEGDKYEQQFGQNAYSLNIGKLSIDLSQLAPVSIPLIMGTALYQTLTEQGLDMSVDEALGILYESVDPLAEMSFISGLIDVLSEVGRTTGADGENARMIGSLATAMAESFANQFIPSVLSSTAKVVDPNARSYSTIEGKVAGIWKNLANKTGFLQGTSEKKVDVRGEEVKNFYNLPTFFLNLLNQTILPATIRIDNKTDLDNEIVRLYDATGDGSVVPAKPSYNLGRFTDANTGETVQVKIESDREYTLYQKEYGQAVYEALQDLLATEWYNRETTTDAMRAEAVANTISEAGSVVRNKWKQDRMLLHYGLEVDTQGGE